MRAFILFACTPLIVLIARTGLGQVPEGRLGSVPEWQIAAGGKMEFEVATVRESAPGTPWESTEPMDGFDGPSAGSFFRSNAPLMSYLLFAYKISDSSQARNLYFKLPRWATSQFFHVEGRAGSLPTRDQFRLMVQSLLKTRFQLEMHREVQQGDEYLLVLTKAGKLGPHISQHSNDRPCLGPSDTGKDNDLTTDSTKSGRPCGAKNWREKGQQYLQMTDVSIAEVANYLSGTGASLAGGAMTPRSGVDGTGLQGHFDLDLQFAQEPTQSTPERDGSPDAIGLGPTFTDALREQLGLKLLSKKGPVEMLVIDHIERPSPE